MNEPALPRVVSAGEALTDFIRVGNNEWRSRPGGAGWNVARIVAALGIPSAFAGGISDDRFGDEILASSQRAGLDARFLQRYAKPALLAMVHGSAPPEYSFIGADSADLYFAPARLPSGWLEAAEWVHFGGISLTREPLRSTLRALLDAVVAAGRRVSYDPNFRNVMTKDYDWTLRYVAERANLIKVSEDDLIGLFRTPDAADALQRLRTMNSAAKILVTRGERGAGLHEGETALEQTAIRVHTNDAIGAGDASVGGMLFSLLRSPLASGESHLRFAVAAGSAACVQSDGSPPTLEQIEHIIGMMDEPQG
ncbi:MAG: carbohydrate kinase [Betaproteobacteria bacterium]